MLPKIKNSKDNIGTPGLQVNLEQGVRSLGSMATVMPRVKPVSNSKKAIEKSLKKTKKTLSSISDFPAFFDFMRKENSDYHQQMEKMEKDLSKSRDVRHKEVMSILLSATKNKRVAEKKIKTVAKKQQEKEQQAPGAPTKPGAPPTQPPAKPTAPAQPPAKPPTQPPAQPPAKPPAQAPAQPPAKPAAPSQPAAQAPTKPTPPAKQAAPTQQPATQAPAKPTTTAQQAPTQPAAPAQPAPVAPKTTQIQPKPATVKQVEPVKPPTAQQVSTPPAAQVPPVKPVGPATPAVTAPATAKRIVETAVAAGTVVASTSALAKIKGHEKFVAKAYPDPEKNPDGSTKKMFYSVGYGHQITEKEVQQGYIQVGDTKVPVLGKLGVDTILTKQQAETLVAQDFSKYETAARAIPNFDKLNQPAQDALIDITYNMGVGWTKKFPSFMKAMSNMELEKAADQLLYADATKTKKTGYFTQVKGRAEENANKIRKGSLGIMPEQLQIPKAEDKIMDMSNDLVEMKRLMRLGNGPQQVILQQNFHNTTNRQHFVPPTKKQELNPTMQ
jgi:GH24 family phage-related lysozyme (muramidase)